MKGIVRIGKPQNEAYRIKRGLDLPMAGAVQPMVMDVRGVALYAVQPCNYVGVNARVAVKEGDTVKAGSLLFEDRDNPAARYTSPVSGVVKEVRRGERRALEAVTVVSDNAWTSESFPSWKGEDATGDEVAQLMCESGLWTSLVRRPFGTVPQTDERPRDIFVTFFESVPLAPDYDFMLRDRMGDLHVGLSALSKLTQGAVHAGFRKGQEIVENMPSCVKKHYFEGPHPAGNIGTQIAAVCPINKGESVWSIDAQSVAILGNLLRTGKYRPERMFAFVGSEAVSPRYYKAFAGASLENIVREQIPEEKQRMHTRIILGSVLSGRAIGCEGFLSMTCSQVCAIPEGDHYDFMGWLAPGLKKFSTTRTFVSGFLPKPILAYLGKKAVFEMDTNLHGDPRPLVFTGNLEQVFPMDIYPLQLLKACIIGDIELMENLGIYEVEPEDFALCEFVDPSKTEMQQIVRQALETIRKEGM